MRKLTLGADPEVFLRDASGALVSAIEKIGGSKECPMELPIGPGFAVQEDNVALEYNIPPAATKEQFQGNINRAMAFLSDYVATKGLAFSNLASASFPASELEHPMAKVFGCDPDFNAWLNGKKNPRPKASDPSLRSCGGHVHVGIDVKDKKDIHELVKYMDAHLAVGMVLMDPDENRKLLYGKPGAFRYKPYGFEYRVLSNYWTLSPKLVDWVWDTTHQSVDAWENKKINFDEDGPLILESVNRNNKLMAERLVDKYQINLV